MDPDPTHSLRVVEGGGDEARPSRSPQRSRPNRGLPTDRLRFDVQLNILQTMGRLSGSNKRPVDSDMVAQATRLSTATAGLCNRFFTESGWIEQVSKGKYVAADALLEYLRRDGVGASDATVPLADALRGSWVWEEIGPFVTDGGAPVGDVIVTLSRAAGAESGHVPQLENLLEWLDFVGLIIREGERVLPVRATSAPPPTPETPANPTEQQSSAAPDEKPAGEREPARPSVQEPTKNRDQQAEFVLTFNVSVNMTASDLARLSPDQIRALYEAVGTVAAITAR